MLLSSKSDAQNTPPFISAIGSRTIGANLETSDIPFTVRDSQTPAVNLVVSGVSSNLVLVPNQNIVFGGSGTNRTVRVKPTTNQIGQTRITIGVIDPDGGTNSSSFLLFVTNTPPTLSFVSSRSINALIPSAVLPITVADRETAAENLILSVESTNPSLIATSNILLSGSGADRTVQFLPSEALGSATIIFTITDTLGGITTSNLQLTIFNTPPAISGVPNQKTVAVNSSQSISFNVTDVETALDDLLVVVASTNLNLPPVENFVVEGSGTNRIVTFTPKLDQAGAGYVSFSVTDSHGIKAETRMYLTVNQFLEISGTGIAGQVYSSAAWGDYDNDGLLDVVVAGQSSFGGTNSTQLYHNQGNGTFSIVAAGFPGVRVGALAWGDFNQDGFLDLAITGQGGCGTCSSPITVVFRNNGNGTFTDIGGNFLGLRSYSSIAWGDYDNDGKLDLLVAGWNTGPTTLVYRNKGDGTFIGSGIPLEGITNGRVGWTDIDNDMDWDIFMTGVNSANQQFTRILRNDSGGNFVELGLNLPGLKEGSASADDYDHDGDLDIFVAGATSGFGPQTFLFRNNGAGNFASVSTGLPGLRSIGCAWADYNNDGSLDVAYPGTVYTNYNGVYSTGRSVLTDIGDGAIQTADYDNDGAIDLLMVGNSSSQGPVFKLFRNFGRQKNTPPEAPASLSSSLKNGSIHLSWGTVADQNQSGHHSYNLRVGTSPGLGNIVSPMSLHNGRRLLPALGNTAQNTNWMLKMLLPGTYYWSVQAIDSSFAGSAFSSEQSFTVEMPILSVIHWTNGQFKMQVTAAEGSSYTIQSSTNLLQWMVLSNVVSASTNVVQVTDSDSEQFARKFYRLRFP